MKNDDATYRCLGPIRFLVLFVLIGCPTNVEKSKAYEVKKSEFEKSKGTV